MDVLLSKGDYTLVHRVGSSIYDTEWEDLEVKSSGDAEKHVIAIKLNPANHMDSKNPHFKYLYNDVYVNHGMRMKTDTLEETLEYIEALKQAVEFAREVKAYCKANGWWQE